MMGGCPLSCMCPAGPLFVANTSGRQYFAEVEWHVSTAQAQISAHWQNQANTNMVHVYTSHKYTMDGCQNSAETCKK